MAVFNDDNDILRNIMCNYTDLNQESHLPNHWETTHFMRTSFLIDVPRKVIMIDDLHGDQIQLIRILNDWLFMTEPSQQDFSLIFLGDYVNLKLFCLHLPFPERFHFLRGNHEFSKISKEYGFRDVLGPNMWIDFNEDFEKFPIYVVAFNKIFCAYGGISATKTKLKELRTMKVPADQKFAKLITDLTWSDPSKEVPAKQDAQEDYVPNVTSGVDKVFTGVELTKRAHECVTGGTAVFASKRSWSIFSEPTYDGGENIAKVTRFSGHGEILVRQHNPMQKTKAENVEINDELTLDKPTAREPKKPLKKSLKRPVKKITGCYVSLFHLRILMLLASIFGVFAVGENTPDQLYHVSSDISSGVDEIGQKLNILSRVVSTVSLSDALHSEESDEMTLAKELFSIGSNVSLDDVIKADLSTIPVDFEKIGNIVNIECSGDEGCAIPNAFLLTVKILDHLTVVPEEGDYTAYIQNITDLVSTNRFGKIAEHLQTMKAKKAAGIADTQYVLAATIVADGVKGLEELFSIFQNGLADVLDGSFFAAHVTFLKSIESVTNDKTGTNLLLKLKTDLKNLHDKFQKMKDVMTDEMMDGMNKKLSFMESIRPLSISEKKLSAGFKDGFNDVKSALNDYKNPWLVKTLNPGKNLSALPTMMKPMESMIQKTEALQKLWKKDPIDSMLSQIKSVSKNLKTSDVLSDIVKVFAQILKSSNGVKLDQKVALDFKTLIATLEDAVKKFESLKAAVEKFETSKSLEHLMEIKKIEKENGKNVTIFMSKMSELTTIDGMIPIVNELHNALKTVQMDVMSDSVNLIKEFDTKVITPFNKWKYKSGMSSLLMSIADEKFLETLHNLNPFLQNLGDLKLENLEIAYVNNLAKTLNDLSEEWKRVKPNLTQTTSEREEAQKSLKIPLNHSRFFGSAAHAVQDLLEVRKLNESIQNILDSGALDGKIQDQKLAGSLKSVQRLDFSLNMERTEIYDVLYGIQHYFDEVFGVKRPRKYKNEMAFPTRIPHWLIGLMLFGPIVCPTAAYIAYLFYKHWQSLK